MKRSLFWYTATNNRAGGVDGSIILAQTAFELLSWTRFTTEKGLSEEGFYDLPAVDKLRLLLIDAGIKMHVPQMLEDLAAPARSHNKCDGPQEITRIRNLLVHPSPKNLHNYHKLTTDELAQAHWLSMWYFDLLLLYFLGYDGPYQNRCSTVRVAGLTEPVPWNLPGRQNSSEIPL